MVETLIHLRNGMTRPDLGSKIVVLRCEDRTKGRFITKQMKHTADPQLGLWWGYADSEKKTGSKRDFKK